LYVFLCSLSFYLKYYGNLRSGHQCHPSLSYFWVSSLSYIYFSTLVSDVRVLSVRRKLINLVFQVIPCSFLEMPAGFTAYFVKIIPIYFTWILEPL
jgi:hypothetical protein